MSGISEDGSEAVDRRIAQDEVLVEALASGWSYARSGDVAGVTGRTVARRMAEPEFARRVSVRRSERVSEVTGLLAETSVDAVGVIRAELHGDRASDRLAAARLTLSLLQQFRRAVELEERLAEVEHRLEIATTPVVADAEGDVVEDQS